MLSLIHIFAGIPAALLYDHIALVVSYLSCAEGGAAAEIEYGICTVRTVSYTHLDVYKRQALFYMPPYGRTVAVIYEYDGKQGQKFRCGNT